MTKLKNRSSYLKGERNLPSGAIALASMGSTVVCLMPDSQWIYFHSCGTIEIPARSLQRDFIRMMILNFGGSAKSMADSIGVEVRTIEGWAQGRPFSCTTAFNLSLHF